jgi:hypothetical protein
MSIATPPDLAEAPELAVLEVLDVTLQQTIYALFAVHPELVSGDGLEASLHATSETWLADIIYTQANNLQHVIQRYREASTRARALRSSPVDYFAE